jgi:hypothetical protein
MNEDVRVIGVCAECTSKITDDMEECWCDEDGNYFDSVECAMTYHRIHLLEV